MLVPWHLKIYSFILLIWRTTILVMYFCTKLDSLDCYIQKYFQNIFPILVKKKPKQHYFLPWFLSVVFWGWLYEPRKVTQLEIKPDFQMSWILATPTSWILVSTQIFANWAICGKSHRQPELKNWPHPYSERPDKPQTIPKFQSLYFLRETGKGEANGWFSSCKNLWSHQQENPGYGMLSCVTES